MHDHDERGLRPAGAAPPERQPAERSSPERPPLKRNGRTPKTSEYLARDIALHIVEHRLPEGTRLATEREMLEAFKVGRTTLREALRLLETRGVITIRSGRQGGPVVRRPRPSDLSDALTLVLSFEATSLSDVLHARQAFEPMIARLAAQRITPQQLGTMRKTIEVMLQHEGDQEVLLEQNMLFHDTIAAASGNPVLGIVSDTLKSVNDGAVLGVTYPPHRHRAVIEAHRQILAALEQHDAERGERAMRAHLDDAGRYWEKKFRALYSAPIRWNPPRRVAG